MPLQRIGFACTMADSPLSTCHTFRLANLNESQLAKTIDQNLADLTQILEWMEPHPLRLFRIGSSLVPFASHAAMNLDWRSMIRDGLAEIGKRFKGFRFSMHPGQYNVLNSPNSEAVEACVRELTYSSEILDMLGSGPEGVVVLHGGGVYGDRQASLGRLVERVRELPSIAKDRLALEHDERYFSLAEIVDVCEQTGVKAIYDTHHFQINPSPDLEGLLARVRDTWPCTPKIHISSQRPDARAGAHDDYVHPADLRRLAHEVPFDFDLMVEAKAKQLAALQVAALANASKLEPSR